MVSSVPRHAREGGSTFEEYSSKTALMSTQLCGSSTPHQVESPPFPQVLYAATAWDPQGGGGWDACRKFLPSNKYAPPTSVRSRRRCLFHVPNVSQPAACRVSLLVNDCVCLGLTPRSVRFVREICTHTVAQFSLPIILLGVRDAFDVVRFNAQDLLQHDRVVWKQLSA